jgi:GTP cyclohydrolase I
MPSCCPQPFRATTFTNDEGYNQMVLLKGIPVRSLCEHHMFGFIGVAHIGYLPEERILGPSKWPGWWSSSRSGNHKPRSG